MTENDTTLKSEGDDFDFDVVDLDPFVFNNGMIFKRDEDVANE